MINRLSILDWASGLVDLILPRTCAVCGGELSLRERHVCVGCLADLPRTYFSCMSRNQLSDRFNALVQEFPAPEPAEGPVYSYATALFFYRAGYKDITRRLKYHADIGIGKYFADMLAEEMAVSGIYSNVDAVIPVPLHWTRRWSRGYNQAEVIAQVLADKLGALVLKRVLYRCRRTRTQTRLSIGKKSANVAGAFKVKRGFRLSGLSHILIVDDVFTTGATLHSCYLALKPSCPAKTKISVAALACVGY